VHLLDAKAQGLNPDYTIADASTGCAQGSGLPWGMSLAMGTSSTSSNCAKAWPIGWGAWPRGHTTRRQRVEQRREQAKLEGQGNTLSLALAKACNNEAVERGLAKDVKALVGWLERDILALADPSHGDRSELFDFIVDELEQREHLDSAKIRPIRVALKRQRDRLPGFVQGA